VLWAATAAGRCPSTPVRAFVAFYPPCGGGLGAYRGSVPVLLLGAKDDWARPGPCQPWAEEARQASQLVTAIVYPGARHAFDARGIQGVVTVPDARGVRAPGSCRRGEAGGSMIDAIGHVRGWRQGRRRCLRLSGGGIIAICP
jgi:dienelactone hydrolase